MFAIVYRKSAAMPASCKFGHYRKIAVVELIDPNGPRPVNIDARHRNVLRVARCWDRRNLGEAGWSGSSAAALAFAAARELAAEINDQRLADLAAFAAAGRSPADEF